MDEVTIQIQKLEIRSEERVNFAMLREKKPVTLTTLPYDIKHLIMESLDTIDSACLGLTNKSFWAIHKKKIPYTNLRVGCGPGLQYLNYNSFADRLKVWMGPDLVYSYVLRRFVSRDRCAEVKAIIDVELELLGEELDSMIGTNRPKLLGQAV